MLKHIPNALTLTRLVLAPVIAWLLWLGMRLSITDTYTLYPPGIDPTPIELAKMDEIAFVLTLAAALFIVAALTDLFDGMAARAFNAHSKLGRIIDPIADKAIVGLPLATISIALWTYAAWLWIIVAIPSAIIIGRDVLMTIVRMTAQDGEGVRVSSLAKWKTALELIVVGLFLVLMAIRAHVSVDDIAHQRDFGSPSLQAGLALTWMAMLWLTAALSAYTGWQYLRPAKKN